MNKYFHSILKDRHRKKFIGSFSNNVGIVEWVGR